MRGPASRRRQPRTRCSSLQRSPKQGTGERLCFPPSTPQRLCGSSAVRPGGSGEQSSQGQSWERCGAGRAPAGGGSSHRLQLPACPARRGGVCPFPSARIGRCPFEPTNGSEAVAPPANSDGQAGRGGTAGWPGGPMGRRGGRYEMAAGAPAAGARRGGR